MKDLLIHYSVGALLYCPANNETIVNSIITERFGSKYSLALCLEDTIGDNFVKEAERTLISSLNEICRQKQSQDFYIPKIFIRVRYPEQISELYESLQDAKSLVTGFIAPKFSLDTVDSYIDEIKKVNNISSHKVYMMPIFESPTIINLQNRYNILYTLKDKLDSVGEYILNIRVGGNDLCHTFGFRRANDETIHDIKPISNIFADIITVFGMDYVISGPVWEYYNGPNWDKGLANELKLDRLCGFTGKTVIHPKQIELVNEAYKVSETDLADAHAILDWNENTDSMVSGSSNSERMNEYKTHFNWARTIIYLSEYYGVK